VFVGLSYFILDRQLTRYNEIREEALAVRIETTRQNELLARQPELLEQLASIRSQLPIHSLNQDLKSEFARQLESLSSQSGLQLTGVTPLPENFLEDLELYRSTIRCTWKGSSNQLIQFLVELKTLGAVADIRELRIQNRTGLAGDLSGTFVLDFVYTRSAETLPATPIVPSEVSLKGPSS
jgi:hypothetical protein